MAVDRDAAEKHLDVLHDHYKETFARARELERSRDRHFLWVIVLFGLLTLQVGYPTDFGGSVQRLTIAGGDVSLGTLPLAALLSATWALTLAIVLRYCQTAVAVDRQYPYVHYLEEQISPLVGGDQLYQREGAVYLTEYPTILNVAWIAYVVVFPVIATLAGLGLVCWEWKELPYPWVHRLFDSAIAGGVVGCFFLLRFYPKVKLALDDRTAKRKQQRSA